MCGRVCREGEVRKDPWREWWAKHGPADGGKALLEELEAERLEEIVVAERGTVELDDENDPDGAVVFRRADGSVAAFMSREAYEKLMAVLTPAAPSRSEEP
jgi:hypothetical protein